MREQDYYKWLEKKANEDKAYKVLQTLILAIAFIIIAFIVTPEDSCANEIPNSFSVLYY